MQMRNLAAFTFVGLFAWLTPLTVQADLILGNTFDGATSSSGSAYATGQILAPGVSSAGVVRDGYIPLSGNNVLRVAETRVFSVPLNFTRFFEFTLTPDLGTTINYDSFEYSGFTELAAGATVGPTVYLLRSSLSSFGTDIPGTAGDSGGTFDLSESIYQDSTSPIEFRLFIQGPNGAGSSPDSTYSLDSFAFNGTVVAVPEASAFLAVGLVACVAGAVTRRRKPRGTAK